MNATDNGMLTIDLSRLGKDVLLRWDTLTPSVSFHHANPLVVFRLTLNQTDRFKIHRSKFGWVPHLARLVRAFEEKYNSLSIDQVWLICKSQSEEGFQRWHQGVPKLEGERGIVKTIVVNMADGCNVT